MKRCKINLQTDQSAQRWARRLIAQTELVLAAYPEADPDNVRHTLILLGLPPLERLQHGLIRGRSAVKTRPAKKRRKKK